VVVVVVVVAAGHPCLWTIAAGEFLQAHEIEGVETARLARSAVMTAPTDFNRTASPAIRAPEPASPKRALQTRCSDGSIGRGCDG
jgi:hypothetical protein